MDGFTECLPLKRIRADRADEPEYRRRFLREAEITAKLAHPGIVPVFGLAESEDGRPGYAMRFVEGETLSDAIRRFYAADKPGRDPGERSLELRRLLGQFIAACNAVAYAHSRGVLHRDLKPGNIMLGKYGETLVVDWGLAKQQGAVVEGQAAATAAVGVLEGDTPDKTRTGQELGTPAYSSPEQAAGRWDEVGPASDVYSLGATLYTILTGKIPSEAVRKGAFELPAEVRRRTPAALAAVCAKAMAPDPAQRYATAKELAEEVERWLADEAVGAYPEGWQARSLRWARRRRTLVTSAVAVLAVASLLLTGATVLLNAARQDEKNAKEMAEAAAGAEKQANDRAQQRLAQLTMGNEILGAVFRNLNPRAEEKGGDSLQVQLGKRLAQAAAQLEGEAVGDPIVVARLQSILGNSLQELGHFDRALPLLEKAFETQRAALGADHLHTLATLSNLALSYRDAGQVQRAIDLLEQVRDALVEKLGSDHPNTLTTVSNLAAAYWSAGQVSRTLSLWEQVRDELVRKLGPDHPDTLTIRHNLASAYHINGQVQQAIHLYEQLHLTQAEKLGPDHADTLATLNNLAVAYRAANQVPRAVELLEQVRAARVKKLGADHPDTLSTLYNLALACQAAGQLPRAIELYEQVRDARVKKLGADHPDTLSTLHELARAYQAAGKVSRAIELYEHVRDARVKKPEPGPPDIRTTLVNLASAYRATGQVPRAIDLLKQVLDASVKELGSDHLDTLTVLVHLALAYQDAGQLPQAIELFEQARDVMLRTLGAEHADTLRTLNNLALAYQAAGNMSRAIGLYEQVRDAQVKRLGAGHPDTLTTLNNLAAAYRIAGDLSRALPLCDQAASGLEKLRFIHEHADRIIANTRNTYEAAEHWEKAEAWQRKWLAVLKERDGAASPVYAAELGALGRNLLMQMKGADAEQVLKECLGLREKLQPDAWTTFNTCSLLGGAILLQRRYADAEPLLVQGYEGLKQRAAKMPKVGKARLTEAAERLVQLYDAWGKPDEAMKWRTQLEKSKAVFGKELKSTAKPSKP